MERFYAVVVGVLRVGRSRDEGQQTKMMHRVEGVGQRARVVGLPLLASFERHQSVGGQSKGVRGSLPSSAMSWEPANRAAKRLESENQQLASMLHAAR